MLYVCIGDSWPRSVLATGLFFDDLVIDGSRTSRYLIRVFSFAQIRRETVAPAVGWWTEGNLKCVVVLYCGDKSW